jgi:hypothetical protein
LNFASFENLTLPSFMYSPDSKPQDMSRESILIIGGLGLDEVWSDADVELSKYLKVFAKDLKYENI